MGTLNGTEANNTLIVSTWDLSWTVNGYGGDDTITIANSFISRLFINGGTGNDSIYARTVQTAIIHGDDGNDDIELYGATSNGARSIYGDAGNDTISGSMEAEYIYGGIWDDVIYGFQGVDHLYGDAGNDTFYATRLTTQYSMVGAQVMATKFSSGRHPICLGMT